MTDVLAALGGGQGGGAPLRVTIVAADAGRHRRLADLLAPIPEIVVLDGDDDAALPGDAALVVHPDARSALAPSRRPQLAPRQREVLIAYAASNEIVQVVAQRLRMTKETLKTHLRRIRTKYREIGRPAPTRRDLYVRAVEDGFIEPPS